MPGPQVCVGGCLRVVAQGMAVGARFRGASGTPPPTVCPGMGGDGSLPLIRPCGATFPQGGRQGLLLAAAGGRGGVGAPRPTDGDMETPAGFTRTPVPGPPHGRGRACPARGFTQAPVNGSVRREGLDPSAGDCPGDGYWQEVSRGVGDAAPYGLPGNGRLPRLTLPTSPPAYSRCCRRQNRWGRSAHRPHARFRRWIRSRGASGHRRSGPEGTGVCCRCNFSSAG